MAPSPPLQVPGAGLLRVIWTLGSTTNAYNVYGVSIGSATINQALANTLDTAVKGAFTTHLASHVHPSVSLQAVGIRSIASPSLTEYIGAGAPVVGAGAGDPLPRGVAMVVTLRTALAGAAHRGRSFIPGWTEAANETDATQAAAAGAAAVAYVTAIGSALSSNGMSLAVVSRPAYATRTTKETFAGGDPVIDTSTTSLRGGAVNTVTSITARNDVWDSQRRRSSGGTASTLFRQPVATSYTNGDGTFDSFVLPETARSSRSR